MICPPLEQITLTNQIDFPAMVPYVDIQPFGLSLKGWLYEWVMLKATWQNNLIMQS